MRVFIAGASGFIGRNVASEVERHHEVIRGTRSPVENDDVFVDLRNYDSIYEVVSTYKPEVIINCAGITSAEGGFDNNFIMTNNFIKAAIEAKIGLRRYILCGSASEYGQVDKDDLPVKESQPLRGSSDYAISKIKEENIARDAIEGSNIELVIARIFNPIGKSMPPKFLLPNLIKQVNEVKDGIRDEVSVSRLDSERDYIDIHDLSRAMAQLATSNSLRYDTYNVGSGVATSTSEIVEYIIKCEGLTTEDINLRETQDHAEQPVASCADITRLKGDVGWLPVVSLTNTIEEAVRHYHESRE